MSTAETIESDVEDRIEEVAAVELPDSPTDDDASQKLSSQQAAHYEKIKSLETECNRLELDYEDKNSDSKAAKKRWEAAVEELRRCIRCGPDGQASLPFGDDSPDCAQSPDAWEVAPITDALSLTEKQREKLEDAGVKTVSEFERLRAGTPDYPRGLRDLPGVGQATVDKWEDEIVEWLSKNQPVVKDDDSDDSGTE